MEMLLFGLNAAGSATAAALFAGLYVWPYVRTRPLRDALPPLLIFSMLRAAGAAFLIDGVVAADLAPGFAVPTAVGDLIASALALATVLALRARWKFARALAWTYAVLGASDLLLAGVQSARLGVEPGQFGATYLLVAINVPTLIVVHLLIFGLLLRRGFEED